MNISKNGFTFASAVHLSEYLKKIEEMTESLLADFVEKYVEMNISIHLWKAMAEARGYGWICF